MRTETKIMWTLLMIPPAFIAFIFIMCFFFSPPSTIGRWQSEYSQNQLLFQTNNVVVIIDVKSDRTTNKTVETYEVLKGGVRIYIKNSDALNLLTRHKDKLHWEEKSATYVRLGDD